MTMTKIAVPRFADDIAPLFDAAQRVAVYRADRDQPVLVEVIPFSSPPGLDRVRALREQGISILICNGIGSQAKSMLQTCGITVINNVTGPVQEALRAYYSGELCGSTGDPIFQVPPVTAALSERIYHARNLLARFGWKVSPGEGCAPFPVDLVAENRCPVCKGPVRAAVCCGMHSHRVDEEIREFHQAAADHFDLLIYALAAPVEVEKTCFEYGIQILDLNADNAEDWWAYRHLLPLLEGKIHGRRSCDTSPRIV
ncbi:MAG: hypothetical protein C4524_14435 [Candidatus Zixiibacteriota bacterium]|nr:MAG: hypothetical protein C4524_14435 [candidate division Zixibacteria bacterium]